MTIAEFIEARIAEDEAGALDATGLAVFQNQTGKWIYEQVRHTASGTTIPIIFAIADRGGKTQVANMETAWHREARAAHISRFDPARVLAECAAKRKIVESVATWRHNVCDDCWYTCPAATDDRDGGSCCDDGAGDECNCGLETHRNAILQPLASVWADHPDYRREWR